jgi:hypothetical protein
MTLWPDRSNNGAKNGFRQQKNRMVSARLAA